MNEWKKKGEGEKYPKHEHHGEKYGAGKEQEKWSKPEAPTTTGEMKKAQKHGHGACSCCP